MAYSLFHGRIRFIHVQKVPLFPVVATPLAMTPGWRHKSWVNQSFCVGTDPPSTNYLTFAGDAT
jgi:hypothetical protein